MRSEEAVRMGSILAALFLLISWAVAGCETESERDLCQGGMNATIQQVIDGDTLRVRELDAPVRLLGINAPETHETNSKKCPKSWDMFSPQEQKTYMEECCFGEQAKRMLESILKPGDAVCLINPEGGRLDMDMYGRVLADAYTSDGAWVNGKMVVGGYARSYDEFPHPTKAVELDEMEYKAQANGAGLWGACSPEG